MGKYKLDREELAKLCRDFDYKQGSYPEHEYEGDALLEFFDGDNKEDNTDARQVE